MKLPVFVLLFSIGVASAETYRAPDGSLSLQVPAGWRAAPNTIGTTPVQVLQPANGGDERMIVGVGPATANSIQELAQQTVQLVTTQLLPGSRLAGQPKFVQGGVAEISYVGPGGQSSWWQAVSLKNNQYVTILAGARPAGAAAIEQQSRVVFASIKLETAPASSTGRGTSSGQLAQMIVGHWTWYHKTDNGGGGTMASTSKEIWIYANGRYQYVASTYVPNMPPGVDPTTTVTGSYQLQGNRLIGRGDNGQQATFTIEMVEGGKGMKIDGELYIRE
jgi:hypothetical protein